MEYTNSGTFFQNRVKKNPKAPDYSGEATLDLDKLGIGQGIHKVRLAGWKKTAGNGSTFLSISISTKQEQGQPARKSESFGNDDPF